MYTISSVGYGTVPLANNQERVLAMFVMVCGAILCAGVTSTVGSIIAESSKTISGHRRYLQATLLFCKSNEISAGTQSQVSSFYNYLHIELNDQREEDDFNLLSPSLQSRLISALTNESLSSMSFIYPKDLNAGFICTATRYMVPYLATPKEVFAVNCKVIIDDSSCDHQWIDGDFFFLRRGKVHTLTNGTSDESGNGNQPKEKHYISPGSNVIPSPNYPTAADDQLTLFIGLSRAVINAPHAAEMANKSKRSLCHVEIKCGHVKRISKVSNTKSDPGSETASTYEWDEFYFFPFHHRRRYVDINLFNADTSIYGTGRLNLTEFLPCRSENEEDNNMQSSKLFNIEEEGSDRLQERTDPNFRARRNRTGNVNVPLTRNGTVVGSVELVINFLVDNKDENTPSEDSFDSDNEGKHDDGRLDSVDDVAMDNIEDIGASSIAEEEDGDITKFDAVSDGYSHLFHLPFERLIELRNLYSIQSCKLNNRFGE